CLQAEGRQHQGPRRSQALRQSSRQDGSLGPASPLILRRRRMMAAAARRVC
ncbi:unnamed protein product, partial [Ectocarpus fasciculatus]